VVEAASGHEALRRVATTLPALVLLDVHLPDMSGMDVCRQLKANPSTAAIPVLLRSAVFTRSSDKAHGLEGGADGYLVEPVEPVELVATVKALLRTQRVEELRRTLEELHVHEEELRQQNDELAGAREAIEVERQRYQELFEFAPDGYVVTDAHGGIQAVNRAAAEGLNRQPA
jgi:DNA-binding response OmpR family regulator